MFIKTGFVSQNNKKSTAIADAIYPIQFEELKPDSVKAGYTFTDPNMIGEVDEYFYHGDHISSVVLVTDKKAKVVQQFAYMPFGELLVDNSTVDLDYRFSAKETDRESGLGYFGARYYDNTSAMWLGVDPLWEKNIGASPYNYCHGNPIMMLDPDGRDDYALSEDGTIRLLEKTKSDHDVLYASSQTRDKSQKDNFIKYNIDREGNKTIANKKIDVNKGILSSCKKTASVKSLPQGNSITSDGKDHLFRYSFGSDGKESMNFFKFVAANTEVEWSLTEIEMNGIRQFDVFSSCNPLYERFGGQFAEAYALNLINFSHSHPKDKNEGNNAVSSEGDRFFRNKIQDKIKNSGSSNSPRFWIYPQGAQRYTFSERVEYTF